MTSKSSNTKKVTIQLPLESYNKLQEIKEELKTSQCGAVREALTYLSWSRAQRKAGARIYVTMGGDLNTVREATFEVLEPKQETKGEARE